MNLANELREFGLFVRGVTRITDAEREAYGFDAALDRIALVGNIGSSYWAAFSGSTEFGDGKPDPLDRWSRRIAETVAGRHGLRPVYPFEGPPYFPFQQWAGRAEGLAQSPIGVMIHPEFGLWHSYRFALLAAEIDAEPDQRLAASPCLSCADQPCLSTCPVGAFSPRGYAVESCAQYLEATPSADCNARGCIARSACPVAPDLRYDHDQARFHLQAFLAAR